MVVMPTLESSPRKPPLKMSFDATMTSAQRRKEGAGDSGLFSDEDKTAKQVRGLCIVKQIPKIQDNYGSRSWVQISLG